MITLKSVSVGRRPKEHKLVHAKIDSALYERLAVFAKENVITITRALEMGAELLLKRGKSTPQRLAREKKQEGK